MPGPEQLIRAAVTLPFKIAWTVTDVALGLLPGRSGDDDDLGPDTSADVEIRLAADDAMTRDREPVEEATVVLEDDGTGHVEPEVEVVAESADPEAPEPPGAEVHVDEPWEGYLGLTVAEVAARLHGQPPELLAAVELYETTHRNRPGVLEALREASRP